MDICIRDSLLQYYIDIFCELFKEKFIHFPYKVPLIYRDNLYALIFLLVEMKNISILGLFGKKKKELF